jgi:hypothetical protein
MKLKKYVATFLYLKEKPSHHKKIYFLFKIFNINLDYPYYFFFIWNFYFNELMIYDIHLYFTIQIKLFIEI